MDAQEIRMRAIEAIASGGGIRDPRRMIVDAAQLAEWVEAAEDKSTAPPQVRQKGADKG